MNKTITIKADVNEFLVLKHVSNDGIPITIHKLAPKKENLRALVNLHKRYGDFTLDLELQISDSNKFIEIKDILINDENLLELAERLEERENED